MVMAKVQAILQIYEILNKLVFRFFMNDTIELAFVMFLGSEFHIIGLIID